VYLQADSSVCILTDRQMVSMMSKDDILGRLAALNISQTTHEHQAVMTSADLANVCAPSTPLSHIKFGQSTDFKGCWHKHADSIEIHDSCIVPCKLPLSPVSCQQVPELAGVDGANVKNLFLKARRSGADVHCG